MTELSIPSCINAPNHYPDILGMALIQDRIDTEGTICILTQSRHQKVSFRLSWGVRNVDRLYGLTVLGYYARLVPCSESHEIFP